MFSKFLHRPALAIVISLLILFMGGLAINVLPISQFPSVAPQSVRVSVSYPGASAKILVDSTLVLLEQAINGVPNMRYMIGDATSAGEGTIQVIFEPGTDPDVAVMNVNNRAQMVKNNLPDIVQREGVIVMQNMTSMLMYINVFSTDPGVDQNFLYNYATVKVLNEIKRIPGVGQAVILGNRAYAMRVELDIDRMRGALNAEGRADQAQGYRVGTLRLLVLRPVLRYRRIPVGCDRDEAKPGLERGRSDQEGQGKGRGNQAKKFSSWDGLRGNLRRVAVPRRIDRKGAPYLVRSFHLGVASRVLFLRRFPQHSDPDARSPCVAYRNFLLHDDFCDVDQFDHPFRVGSGNRRGRRRCDRGRRSGPRKDALEAFRALCGHQRSDSRSQRCHHRYYAGHDSGVHSVFSA
jgi:hypothetical protein